MGMIKEFKEFAMRGNVVDMAIGVVIGGAFGKIVTSLVNDVIMPPIGAMTGGVDFNALEVVLKSHVDEAGAMIVDSSIKYGAFIQTIIDFIIVALCIFAIVKAMNAMKKKEEAAPEPAPAPAPEPSAEEKLLTEIRDLLKKK